VTPVELLGNLMRFGGLLVTIVGLWFSAGGIRVVVSGRIDERRRSKISLKKALALLVVGLLLFIAGTWIFRAAQPVAIVPVFSKIPLCPTLYP
jgi:hypothetical protein